MLINPKNTQKKHSGVDAMFLNLTTDHNRLLCTHLRRLIRDRCWNTSADSYKRCASKHPPPPLPEKTDEISISILKNPSNSSLGDSSFRLLIKYNE